MMKKMISMWLIVLLVFTSMPVTFAGLDDPCVEFDFTCEVIGEKVKITGYTGTATDVVIPSEIDGKTVTAIGDYAFKEKGLTSVLIPENVTVIGSQAFISNKLKYVVIPANVETIGSYAFYENRIEHITFNGIPNLDQSPFGNQSFPLYTDEGLQTMWDGISVPDGGKVYVKRIPDAPTDVTAVAGFEEATVSFKGPTHSGGNAVIGYTVKVFIDGTEQTGLKQTGNASPITVTGLTNGKAYTFKVVATNAAGNSVESEASAAVTLVATYETTDNSDGTVTITKYNGTAKDIEIPGEIGDKTVTTIGDNAFKEKGLTNVSIPSSVKTIGVSAFSDNQLTNVTITYLSDGITIKENAFRNNKITSVTLPLGVIEVGDNAFSENDLTSVVIPASLYKIGKDAFKNNKISSVTVPSSAQLKSGAFSHNLLKDVTLNIGVGTIVENAFSHNQLTSVTLPVSVGAIETNAFSYNQLERITFKSTPTIGVDAFKQNTSVFPEFVGWYTDESLQTAWDGTTVPAGKELYAKRKPNAPTELTAAAGQAQATVSFTPPTHTGGNVVTEYTVKVYVDGTEQTGLKQTGNASPITVTGLTNGKAYTFKVVATNAAGNSVESEASTAVTPVQVEAGKTYSLIGALDIANGISTKVIITKNVTSTQVDSAYVVFQLMKGSTPVSIIAIEKNLSSITEEVGVLFNSQYDGHHVNVYVLSKSLIDQQDLGTSLAEAIKLEYMKK